MTLTASKLDDAVVERIGQIVGREHLSRTDLDRRAYARDLWPLELIRLVGGGEVRYPPDVVAWPGTVEEVCALVAMAHERKIPVVAVGAGSGVCGGAIPVRGGIVLDVKRLERVLEVNEESLLVTAETGILGPALEDECNRHGLTLGHFPSSIHCSTLGGWLAARSAGQCSSRYGKIEDMVRAVDVVLPDGELACMRTAPRRATGPDFAQLFVGSEGTLGVIVRATLRAWPYPEERIFRGWEFAKLEQGLEAIRVMMRAGLRPAVVRLYDELDTVIVARGARKAKRKAKKAASQEAAAKKAAGQAERLEGEFVPGDDVRSALAASAGAPWRLAGWLEGISRAGTRSAVRHAASLLTKAAGSLPVSCLMVTVFEGERGLGEAEARIAAQLLREHGGTDRGEAPARRWWAERYAVSYKLAGVFKRGMFCDTMEVASSWDRLAALYDGVRGAIGKHAVVMAHFSHAYPEGCSIYFTFAADAGDDPAKMEKLYRKIWQDGLSACLAAGGTISHHHGVGLSKAEFMEREHGGMMRAFQAVKDALDPHGIMNPGKLGLR